MKKIEPGCEVLCDGVWGKVVDVETEAIRVKIAGGPDEIWDIEVVEDVREPV